MNTQMTSEAARVEVESQGVLNPGTVGWWRVWGATISHVKPGDVICYKGNDMEHVSDWVYIQDVFEAKSLVRRGFVIDGEHRTLGLGVRVGVLRRGDRHTLA